MHYFRLAAAPEDGKFFLKLNVCLFFFLSFLLFCLLVLCSLKDYMARMMQRVDMSSSCLRKTCLK